MRLVTFTDEALDVEMFVLHPQHLSFAGLATVLAQDWAALGVRLGLLLLHGTVYSLLLLKR